MPAPGGPDGRCLSSGASPFECPAYSDSGGPQQQAPSDRALSPTDRLQPNTSTAPADAQPPVPSANTPSKAQPAAKSAPGTNGGLPPKAAAKAGEEGQTKLLLDEEEERRKLRRRKKVRAACPLGVIGGERLQQKCACMSLPMPSATCKSSGDACGQLHEQSACRAHNIWGGPYRDA